MRERPQATAAKPIPRRATFSVDVVLLTPRGKQLAVLLMRSDDVRARERWSLPHGEPRDDEAMIDTARRIEQCFVSLRLIVRHPPALTRARFVGTNEQHRELLAPRREKNDIDGKCRTPRSRSRSGCLRAFAHHARISHERILMSRPREICHESTPT